MLNTADCKRVATLPQFTYELLSRVYSEDGCSPTIPATEVYCPKVIVSE